MARMLLVGTISDDSLKTMSLRIKESCKFEPGHLSGTPVKNSESRTRNVYRILLECALHSFEMLVDQHLHHRPYFDFLKIISNKSNPIFGTSL